MGNDEYQITFKIYRDCSSNNTNGTDFDQNASIAFYDQHGGLIQSTFFPFPGGNIIPNNTNNPCWIAPPDVCVEEAIYTQVMTLPPIPGGYDVAYQRCCRNPSTLNIISPSDVGSTYLAHIPDEALATCNSSPSFNEFPPTILCVNAPIVFDHSATDPDGDSLVYELCAPYIGADPFAPQPSPPPPPPYGFVTWAAGYSASTPMNSLPMLTVDPQTGLMTGTPTLSGQFVVGVCVSEYRNGVLLSTNKRDFQFNVASCNANVISSIQDQTTFCDGFNVDFSNLSLNSQTYFWDFGDQTTDADTAVDLSPSYTYQDTGVYEVTLVANPGWPCADTSASIFEIFPPIIPEFDPPPIACFNGNSLTFEAAGQFFPYADFSWEFGNAAPSTSTTQNPTGIHFNALGDHSVTLTIFENGCQESFTDVVEIFPNPVPIFDALEKEGCMPFTTQFTENSTAWTDLQWLWDFGDGGTSTDTFPIHTWTAAGLYDVSLTISTDSACIDTIELIKPALINVLPIPTAGFSASPNEVTVLEPFTEVTDHSADAVSWTYNMGDDFLYYVPNFGHSFQDGGIFEIMQVVTNTFGCMDTAYQKVIVVDQLFYAPNAFTPDGDGLNDEFLPSVIGAQAYELLIYDRWGDIVFKTNDPKQGWSGTSGGINSPIDTYVYRAVVQDISEKELEYIGHFTLVR